MLKSSTSNWQFGGTNDGWTEEKSLVCLNGNHARATYLD
jgi:hypothetical protein